MRAGVRTSAVMRSADTCKKLQLGYRRIRIGESLDRYFSKGCPDLLKAFSGFIVSLWRLTGTGIKIKPLNVCLIKRFVLCWFVLSLVTL